MLKLQKYFFALIFCLLSFEYQIFAQKISISLGATEIPVDGNFQISVTAENDQITELDQFPDIEGLRKVGRSQSNSMQIVNGRVSRSQSIIQNYQPTKPGIFKLKPFKIKVNGQEITHQGATIKVTEQSARSQYHYDPFADFFGEAIESRKQEFVEVNEDAFFSVSSDKREVFVGEGFTMSIAFYVALNSGGTLQFYNLNEQFAEILKKVKPTSCWEEKNSFENVEESYVKINGKDYKQYKFYQSTFYPLNDQNILIPKVGLKMIKYKIAKRPTFFGKNMMEDFKTYYSEAKTIKVKPLPDHPLKGKVSVGYFQLSELPAQTSIQTGQGAMYAFVIKGEGNIAAIAEPKITPPNGMTISLSSTRQNINRTESGTVFGSKAFEYFIEPLEPGVYPLSNAIQWFFFNTKTQKYDTLKPKTQLTVSGSSVSKSLLPTDDKTDFYSGIEKADNQMISFEMPRWNRWLFNGLVFMVWLWTILSLRKKKADHV